METPIIVAIISGSVAIASPLITYVVTRMIDRRKLKDITGRRKAVIGSWQGNLVQEMSGTVFTIELEMTFVAGKKTIEGRSEFYNPITNQITRLRFTGGFYHEQFVKLDYTNTDELVVQFGCSILKLSADGRSLEGSYVGYGSVTNQIVVGKVTLHRTV